MNKGVWVFAEQLEDELQKDSIKLLGEGRRLADRLNEELSVILIGCSSEKLIDTLCTYGADQAYILPEKSLKVYSPETYTRIVVDLAKEYLPTIIFFATTSLGNDLAPRVAANLKVGLISNVIDFNLDGKDIVARKPVYGGNANAYVRWFSEKPYLATVDIKALEIKFQKPRKTGRIFIDKKYDVKNDRVRMVDFIKADPKTVDVSESEIVIGIGKGLGGIEHLENIVELAEVLGASIGGTRPAFDEKWIPYERQIGISGKFISPKLYIACGISGDANHTVGIKEAELIIAINTNESAPIFKVAQSGVVGDLHKFVPELTNQLRALVRSQKS